MLNMSEAAEFVGIRKRTFEQFYRSWRVPSFKVGRTVVFREDELAEWLESKRVAV